MSKHPVKAISNFYMKKTHRSLLPRYDEPALAQNVLVRTLFTQPKIKVKCSLWKIAKIATLM